MDVKSVPNCFAPDLKFSSGTFTGKPKELFVIEIGIGTTN
jgi:hypothetical protein